MRPWILNSPRTTEAVCELIKTKPTDGKWQVSIERITRSQRQNRRYFAILEQIAYWMAQKGEKHSKEVFHLYFKQEFLEPNSEVVKGKLILDYESKKLPMNHFNDYMEKVCAWAANEGITILDEQEWAEFRRGQ